MRGLAFVVLLIFSVMPFVVSSATETVVVMSGCYFEYNGEIVPVSLGHCSSGDAAGYFYCSDTGVGYETLDEGGCAMDGSGNACCPSGYFCNETTEICDRMINPCEDIDDPDDCVDVGCFWAENEDQCITSRLELSCDYYKDASSCVDDELELGQEGVGSEYCSMGTISCGGIYVFTNMDSCSCEWYGDDEGCQRKLTANLTLSGDTGSFSCSSSYTLGECLEDGTQSVSWISSVGDYSGYFEDYDIPDECLDALGCNGGATTRFCGSVSVSLPFFGFFSILVSLFLICFYYVGILYFVSYKMNR